MHNAFVAVVGQDCLFHGVDLAMLGNELGQCSERVIESGTVLLDPRRKNDFIYILLQ